MGGGLMMRRWCAVFLCLGLTSSGWCAAQDGEVHFKGTIGADMAFEMTLSFSGTNVSGTYFYVGRTVSLRIKGERSGHILKLNEFTESGAMTGQFSGTFLTPTKVEGQWNRPDGSKTLPFSMESDTSATAGDTASVNDGSARADGFVVGEIKSHRVETKDTAQDAAPEAAPSEGAAGAVAKGADAAPATAAQDEEHFQTVEAKGVGTTPDGALKDAFSSAVQTAVGVVVDAETLVKNDEVIRDQVLTYSDAIIEKYEELRRGTRPDGLHEVTIKAVVRRKQLVERLKVAGVTRKPVDGKSIYAEIVSEEKSTQDAAALIQAKIKQLDYPNCIIKARLLSEKPRVVEKRQSDITIAWDIEISIDQDAYYRSFLPAFQGVIEEVSVHKLEKVFSSGGKVCAHCEDFFRPALQDDATFNIVRNNSNINVVLLMTRSNSSLSNYDYKVYQLSKPVADSLRHALYMVNEWGHIDSQRAPTLKIDLLDNEKRAVHSSQINIQERGGSIVFSYGAMTNTYLDAVQLVIGPRIVAYQQVFAHTMNFSFSHSIPLDDLKNVVETKLSFVSSS